MEIWFSEFHTPDVKLSIRVNEHLYTEQTEFQRIDVFDTPEFGRMLIMDECMMLTDKDEFVYHEMITHVPMAVHPNVKRALIIGGGDGGALRELTRFPSLEHVDLVEIDEAVVRICREYFPKVACAFDDPRLAIHYADGLKFVRGKVDEYDLIIVDSTDPFGPGESLFTKEFYGNCYKALKADGLLVNQMESPYYKAFAREARNAYRKTATLFPIHRLYQAYISTYPSGLWLFGFISKKYDPLKDFDEDRYSSYGLDTRYYNPDLHRGAFALPTFVKTLIGDE